MKAFLVLTGILVLIFPFSTQQKRAQARHVASSWNMIPSRSLAGPHYLFKGYTIKESDGTVKVTGPVIEITGGDHLGAKVHPEGYVTEIDVEDFEDEQEHARAVFEATSRTGKSVGTAFLVGPDLVLTNRHVMAYPPGQKNLECGIFKVKLNHRDESVGCEKVRYCSRKHDFCVIELKKLKTGESVGSEVKPLRLSKRSRSNPEMMLLHIGNAAGMGIQASRGRGFLVTEGEFYHYAPTLIGSSGAPILNERGEVIGINWGHTGTNHAGDEAYNRGVLISTVFTELQKGGYQRTIKDVKSFRSWLRRGQGPRELSISLPSGK